MIDLCSKLILFFDTISDIYTGPAYIYMCVFNFMCKCLFMDVYDTNANLKHNLQMNQLVHSNFLEYVDI